MTSDPAPAPAPAELIGAIVTRPADAQQVWSTLDAARDALGTDVALDQVVLPSQRVACTLHRSGALERSDGIVLVSTMHRWVLAQAATQPPPTRRGTILLASGRRTAMPSPWTASS